ncbi:glycosyltransferase family 2 protein [Aequorivita echinoideorum]|uniref:Glycosyltransferase n=1 Tax=Aequorivita echinoideorum TaxID=1549647 RepID=A0ABS5S5F2_9FLAO|nr:glycosyltransferase [Aequorivita echinoideorum]MBT0608449.1 glycosyltransferase [Aequorivita echinoideorum]
MSNTLITILLATYNRAHLIEETLRSIQNQTHVNFECFITDDNSSDDTAVTVKRFCQGDPRFHYFLKPEKYPKGLSANRNFGLDLAEKHGAQYIQFFDDDDIMHPRKLELQLKPFLVDKKLDLTICCYRKFDKTAMIEFDLDLADDKSCHIKTGNLLKSFYLNKINLNSLGPLWKAEVLKRYRFDERLRYTEERDFYLRIFLLQKIRYVPVPYILFWYRKHEKAITSNLYEDNGVYKKEAKRISETNFLNLVLKQEKAPYFLLKSFLKKAIITNNSKNLKGVNNYVLQKIFDWKLRYFTILVLNPYFRIIRVFHNFNFYV